LPDTATIPIGRSSTFPSTEQTLASLSTVVNGGGLGQVGDVIHNFNTAFEGRQGDVRQLLQRLDVFLGNLNGQSNDIIAIVGELNRFAGTFAAERDSVGRALREIPPALDVLIAEEPRLVGALERLGVFSDTARAVITETQDDLVRNLENLDPTIRALADVGDDIDSALGYLTTFPLSQNLIDRGIRGDYMNLFVTIDLTKARLKRGLLAGTRFGDEDAPLVPAPGDPGYDAFYTHDPMGVGVTPTAQLPPPPPPIDVPAPTGGG
jgi:ABC-type transporter Mla subunit MlaD